MLQVDDVTVVFGGVTAVSEVGFTVPEGRILGLIGPNGAGKTTLMRVITGVVTPVRGSIVLAGRPLSDLPPHQRIRAGIGLSQQLVHPFRSMSVVDNVTLAAGFGKTGNPLMSIFRCERARERRKAMDILRLLGLEQFAGSMPANLPLGCLKRLELARALALEPKILLLDEPLAGLNQLEARKLADILVELQRMGRTILLIEHNLREVVRICGRLVVIDNGRKICEGEPQAVMHEPAVRTAYLGEGYHAAA